jgi:hypothetical protein
MVEEDFRARAVRLFLAVADGTVSEANFWSEMEQVFREIDNPIIALAFEEAHHYWGNFHAHNIFQIPVRPDPDQVAQGKELFRTLARALEEGWSIEQTEEAIG